MIEIPKEILDTISSSKKILLASHVSPDADAYGSMCGLGVSLKAQGKSIDYFNIDGSVEKYQFLPAVADVRSELTAGEAYDCIVICDCGDKKRVGDGVYAQLEAFGTTIINIDHHISNDGFGTYHLICVDQASTSDIIVSLLNTLEYAIPADAAQCLLAGIIGDTGSFRYSNTTADVLEKAAQLVRSGASPDKIAAGLYGAAPLGAVKLQAEAIQNMTMHQNGKVAEVLVTQEMFTRFGTSAEHTDFLVEKARDIEGVQASIFIREADEYWKVSLRSRPDTWNVSDIAMSFGGGGHLQAAGFRFRGDLEELRTRLLKHYEADLE